MRRSRQTIISLLLPYRTTLCPRDNRISMSKLDTGPHLLSVMRSLLRQTENRPDQRATAAAWSRHYPILIVHRMAQMHRSINRAKSTPPHQTTANTLRAQFFSAADQCGVERKKAPNDCEIDHLLCGESGGRSRRTERPEADGNQKSVDASRYGGHAICAVPTCSRWDYVCCWWCVARIPVTNDLIVWLRIRTASGHYPSPPPDVSLDISPSITI